MCFLTGCIGIAGAVVFASASLASKSISPLVALLGHSIYAIGAESVYPLSTSLISAHFSGRGSVFAISVINSVAKLGTCAVYFVAPKVSKPFIVTCLLGVVCFVAGTICMFLAKSAPSQGTYTGAKSLGQWYHSSKIVLLCLSFVFGATSLAPLNCHLSNLLQKSYLITAEKANAMIWGKCNVYNCCPSALSNFHWEIQSLQTACSDGLPVAFGSFSGAVQIHQGHSSPVYSCDAVQLFCFCLLLLECAG